MDARSKIVKYLTAKGGDIKIKSAADLYRTLGIKESQAAFYTDMKYLEGEGIIQIETDPVTMSYRRVVLVEEPTELETEELEQETSNEVNGADSPGDIAAKVVDQFQYLYAAKLLHKKEVAEFQAWVGQVLG